MSETFPKEHLLFQFLNNFLEPFQTLFKFSQRDFAPSLLYDHSEKEENLFIRPPHWTAAQRFQHIHGSIVFA